MLTSNGRVRRPALRKGKVGGGAVKAKKCYNCRASPRSFEPGRVRSWSRDTTCGPCRRQLDDVKNKRGEGWKDVWLREAEV